MVTVIANITNETTMNVILLIEEAPETKPSTAPPIPSSIVCPKNQAIAKFNEILEIETSPNKNPPHKIAPN